MRQPPLQLCTRRYGDECCGGRVSLLHFCVVLVMAGVVVLTVGAVQFKQEIYLYSITITRTPSEKCTLCTKPWLWHSESNDVISGNSNLHLTGG